MCPFVNQKSNNNEYFSSLRILITYKVTYTLNKVNCEIVDRIFKILFIMMIDN